MDGARRVDHTNSDRRKTHQVSARLRLAKLIGALDVALAPHLVHLLPRLRCRIVTAVGSRVHGKVNVNVGWGHARSRHCGERAGAAPVHDQLALVRIAKVGEHRRPREVGADHQRGRGAPAIGKPSRLLRIERP